MGTISLGGGLYLARLFLLTITLGGRQSVVRSVLALTRQHDVVVA